MNISTPYFDLIKNKIMELNTPNDIEINRVIFKSLQEIYLQDNIKEKNRYSLKYHFNTNVL